MTKEGIALVIAWLLDHPDMYELIVEVARVEAGLGALNTEVKK